MTIPAIGGKVSSTVCSAGEMPVIFLDIDGMLVNREALMSGRKRHERDKLEIIHEENA